MSIYSIKMRASKNNKHVSGAERIILQNDITKNISALVDRALHHSLGRADFINIKLEEIHPEELEYLDVLPVSTRATENIDASYKVMREILNELNLDVDTDELINLLRNSRPMRGAILYDIATKKSLAPNPERGIRVTYMDAECPSYIDNKKNHFREAIVLATKVLHAPGIISELCMSDDPEYVTGYISSLKHGYVRLTPLKELGNKHGGRVFIFDSRKANIEDTITYLEKQKVLVRGLPPERPVNEDPQKIYEYELKRMQKNNLYRSMHTLESAQSKIVKIGTKKVLLFSSNSYLDLCNDLRLKKAVLDAVCEWGVGSGGSRLATGNTSLHEQLEQTLAKFKETESALLFNTGYMANVGIISALCNKESVIFSDEYNHASIIDGCHLSKAKIIVYKHNNMQDLEQKIKTTSYKNGLIVSDAVFSMDGDIANLPQIVNLGQKYHLLTMLDEAHATGVIGTNGHGIVEYYNNICKPDILMGTLSKALGSEGGFACGSKLLIEYLKNKARSFIFATSQTPASIAASLCALKILSQEPQLSQKLQYNVKYFLRCLATEGIKADSQTAIIPIIIGDAGLALKISEELLEQGFLIPAIRYPTVPQNTARLRVALMATHTQEELSMAAYTISSTIKKYLK